MNLISQILRKKRQNSSYALIPFVTAGYPSIDLTVELLLTLGKKGADVIELGIPYSDALADGHLIQNASKVALQNGVYVDEVINILKRIDKKINVPIIIFTYYNPILVRGLSSFVQEISQVGVKGLIIPDLPIEETDYVLKLCLEYRLELIFFISPISSQQRILNILSKAPGCVYLVSSTGVTGIRDSISENASYLCNYINSKTDKQIMLGFGISSPSQVSKFLHSNLNIDAIVIGSAFTRIIVNNSSVDYNLMLKEVGNFCEQMKSSLNY
uniref:Tryptophan synthase alpha chain n=1 Tax=Herposiphonia versicolor TaxID=2007163 RepID=A0A1Z1MFX1_9FLOR|nr:Tryptophan synthase alpha subunit [Herposiphonia versicolor]ARW64715.1 Tryptophan synthase alpha subunit [Herposiphonia versicolor]